MGGGEAHSECCSKSTSSHQRHHSPTVETMATSTTSAGSSPSPSLANANAAVCDNQNIPEMSTLESVQQGSGKTGNDDNDSPEEVTKASWESGILDLSSSAFITVKLLVSNNMAGSIIGRAGETINDLQDQSSSRIKLGQSGDYYPGTSERACLVHGSLESVKKAATLLLQKLYDLQLQQMEAQLGRHSARQRSKGGGIKDEDDVRGGTKDKESDGDSEAKDDKEDSAANLSFSVRLLIPSASCGMLIGRNGINIKKMKETSRVSSIRLSAKEPDHSNSNMHFSSESAAIAATSERILTITGNELNACISCAFLILEGFARHPDICRYANNTTSYSKITSSFHSHYASNQVGYSVRSSREGAVSSMPQPRGGRSNTAYLPSHHSQNIQRMQRPLRFNSERSTESGIIMHGPPPTEDRRTQHQQQIYRNAAPVIVGQLGTQVAPPAASHIPTSSMYGGNVSSGSRHSQNISQDPQQQIHSVKISVPDTMVGAILGKRGQTLTELEKQSGTKIKISQRGEFLPGTNKRIVTISGPNNESITLAESLIRQQLARNSHHDRMISSPLPDEES